MSRALVSADSLQLARDISISPLMGASGEFIERAILAGQAAA